MRIDITGPRGCGKTTIAKKIKSILESEGKLVIILNGDKTPQDLDNFDVIITEKI